MGNKYKDVKMKKFNIISLLSTLLIANNALSMELSRHLGTSSERTY